MYDTESLDKTKYLTKILINAQQICSFKQKLMLEYLLVLLVMYFYSALRNEKKTNYNAIVIVAIVAIVV